MPSLPLARISHFTARRLRIRIPEKRRDAGFFSTVADRLATWESIETVETNPLTASVLVHFSDPQRLFAEAVAKNDLFDIDWEAAFAPPSAHSVTQAAARSFETADIAVRRWSENRIDMRGLVFLLLLAGGTYQLLRRSLATPAPTLLWYAGDLLGLWRGRPGQSTVEASTDSVSGRTG
jgi:hypothetical protein